MSSHDSHFLLVLPDLHIKKKTKSEPTFYRSSFMSIIASGKKEGIEANKLEVPNKEFFQMHYCNIWKRKIMTKRDWRFCSSKTRFSPPKSDSFDKHNELQNKWFFLFNPNQSRRKKNEGYNKKRPYKFGQLIFKCLRWSQFAYWFWHWLNQMPQF